jgi:tetratricopeptide (TPR) repeat protein
MRTFAGLFFFAIAVQSVRVTGQIQSGSQSSTIPSTSIPKPSGDAAFYAAESLVGERLDTVYHYAADGTGSKEIIGVMRIQSDAAARQYGVLTIPFASSIEHVEIAYVRVRKPDGTIVETPVTDAQEMPQEVTREAPFYSDLKEKQLPVRNLRVGDRLEYKATVVRTKPEAPGDFWGQEGFGTGVVILSESIELHVPKNKYVKVWSPEHQPTITEAADEKIYRWTGSQLKPTILSADEKKKAADEEAKKAFNPDGDLPAISWTTFKSWEDIGAWYRGLEGDRMVPDADVKAKTAEIISGKTTDEEKIRAIYAYVATQVRYIGVALGIGRYQPHAAGEVLRNQYGDCKDKHTLLAAMLTAAGFHPEASLIGAGIRLNEDVPSPSAFNHLITALPLGGTTIWLDSTAEVAPYRMLVIPIRDKQTLVVPDTGVAMLKRTPAVLPFTPSTTFTAKGTLAENGTAKAHMEYITRGDDEIVMRAVFRQVPPGQWDQLVQNLSQRLGFTGTTSHTEADRPDTTTDPFKLSYDYEREKLGDWDNLRIVPLMPMAFVPIPDDKDPPTEPIDLGQPHVDTTKTILTLPDGWGVLLPDAIHQKNPYITFDKTYKIEGHTLTVERRIEILQRRIPVAEWKTYKKWTDAVFKDGEPWIQLITNRSPKKIGSSDKTVSSDTNNSQVEDLMKETLAQIQRGEANAASDTLDKATKINDKQPGLWALIGYLRSMQGRPKDALEAFQNEVAISPSNYQVLAGVVELQLNLGQTAQATESMRTLMKLGPFNDKLEAALPGMLEKLRLWNELVTLLESQVQKDPDSIDLQIQLGSAQIKAGKAEQGKTTLLAALKKTKEPGLLNDGAYSLADADMELPLAEQYARSAIESFTTRSSSWNPNTDSHDQKDDQAQMVATWDTLAWILYKEDHLEEAEGYARAAWRNTLRGEAGLHLGLIEEKSGRRAEALALYEIALSLLTPLQGDTKGSEPNPDAENLRKHIAQLKQGGIKPNASDAQNNAQKLRTLPAGSNPGKNLLTSYSILVSDGKLTELAADGAIAPADKDISDALVRRANFSTWTPPNSAAKIIRKGTLNCHAGTCEFVVNPL